MSGQGFGAFMEGVQGGAEFGMKARRHRQEEKIYDSAIRKIGNEEKADEQTRAQWNKDNPDNPVAGDTFSMGDPLATRVYQWFQGLGKDKGETAIPTVTPDPGAAAASDKATRMQGFTPAPAAPAEGMDTGEGEGLIPYADGGKATAADEEKAREQARAERYNATAKQAIPAVGNVAGQIAATGPRATRGAMESLADVVDSGTDDPLDGGRFGEVVGQPVGRWVEGAFDAPRAFAGSLLRGTGRAVEGAVTGGDQPAPKPAAIPPGPSAPVGSAARTKAVSRAPGAPPAAPTGPAVPTAPAAPAPDMATMAAKIPWDKVNPIELPKFKTQDWEAYRRSSMQALIQRGGVTMADAFDKVDQQVIGMQQRGTKALLQQAIMRQQSGDLKGAANALVQMFQYIPTGTDAVVGEYNGQLVAQFIDEQTGKPVGEPTPVNGQMLQELYAQYANPAEWVKIADDRKKLENEIRRTGIMEKEVGLRERTLNEVQIPSMQSENRYRTVRGVADMATATGAAGGMKPSDALASDKDVRDTVASAVMATNADGDPLYPELADSNVQSQLIAAIAKIRRQTGGNSEDILLDILKRAGK